MKKSLYIIGILAAAASCTTNEVTDTTLGGDAISFTASDISTRVIDAGISIFWEDTDMVAISTDDKSAIYSMKDLTTGELSYSSGDLLCVDKSGAQTFYAYSPASMVADADDCLTLDLTDQSDVDLLVRSSAVSYTAEAEFYFSPVYTKITFYLSAGYIDIKDITGATATLSGANTGAKYDYVDDEFSSETSSTITSTVEVDDLGGTATVSFYLLETESMNGTLTIEVDGITFRTTFDDLEWLRGYKYDYEISVGDAAPRMILADFNEGGIYSEELPVDEVWVITDSGIPTASQFEALNTKLYNLTGRVVELIFPNMTAIPAYALDYAFALKSFYAPGITSIGSFAFERCTSMSGDLELADSILSIGEYAFSGCESLSGTLTLPTALESIGGGAFSGSAISGEVSIPSSVISMGHSVFELCDGITAITVDWTESIPQITEWTFPSAFYASDGTLSISIPTGTLSDYQATSVWSYYGLLER